MKQPKSRIVIAGGGTAGWMTACALAKKLGHCLDITLIESDQIASVGVGEATIPTMQSFHMLLQLDEQAFMRETQATFKLGIQFENWGAQGDKYFHSFGETGQEFWAGQFQHLWLKGKALGIAEDFSAYSPELNAAYADKFAITKNPRLGFAYHLDATLYAKYLRAESEKHGVTRIEGQIARVELGGESENIQRLHLASGEKIEGDLFVDCTGFRSLLLGEALQVDYEDWSHWFQCDRAVAVQTQSLAAPVPYTRSIAHSAGWQWRIPLQSRVGNGLVYSSKYIDDDDAKTLLLENIEGPLLNDPRIIKFQPGRRKKVWHKNCVAIGLSSGFIEPLESTSIHLISSAVIRLMRMAPLSDISHTLVDEFNRQSVAELEDVRDFIILHYKQTARDDSAFWRHCSAMEVPSSLQTRMALYKERGAIYWRPDELFTVNSWNQVLLGQGCMPQGYHSATDGMTQEQLEHYLGGLRTSIQGFTEKLPAHGEFIKQYCQSEALK